MKIKSSPIETREAVVDGQIVQIKVFQGRNCAFDSPRWRSPNPWCKSTLSGRGKREWRATERARDRVINSIKE